MGFERRFIQVKWAKTHDKEAREVALRAKAVGEKLFSPDFMACYVYCSVINYHSKLKIDLDDNKLLNTFNEVNYVCNSKRGKRNDCIRL